MTDIKLNKYDLLEREVVVLVTGKALLQQVIPYLLHPIVPVNKYVVYATSGSIVRCDAKIDDELIAYSVDGFYDLVQVLKPQAIAVFTRRYMQSVTAVDNTDPAQVIMQKYNKLFTNLRVSGIKDTITKKVIIQFDDTIDTFNINMVMQELMESGLLSRYHSTWRLTQKAVNMLGHKQRRSLTMSEEPTEKMFPPTNHNDILAKAFKELPK